MAAMRTKRRRSQGFLARSGTDSGPTRSSPVHALALCFVSLKNRAYVAMQKMFLAAGLLLASLANHAFAAGHLVVERAWIRSAPPGAMMLAGYATLRNDGDAPVSVTGADSADFGSVSLHESVEEGGVVRMRALGNIEIAPGERVVFEPGGKHFMLMRPKRDLSHPAGDEPSGVKLRIITNAGDATAKFDLRGAEP